MIPQKKPRHPIQPRRATLPRSWMSARSVSGLDSSRKNQIIDMPRNRVNVGLTVANVIGVTAYLVLASFSWINPAERSLGYLAEPYIWALGAARVLVFFLL